MGVDLQYFVFIYHWQILKISHYRFLGKTTCTNSNAYNGSCCTSSDPCAVGGGDCDADSEFAGSAICGNNNCVIEFGYSGWESTEDCCTNSTSKDV